MRTFLIGMIACAALVVGSIGADARRIDNPNSGYCPENTCGPNGGKKTKDVSQCTPQNCSKKKGSGPSN